MANAFQVFDSQKSGAAKAQAQSSSTLQTAQDQSSSSLQADTGAKRGSNSTEAPSLAKRQKDNSGRPSTSRSRSRQPPTTPTAPATPTTSKGKGKDKSNTQAKKPQKATEPAAEKQSVSRNATQKKRARIRDGMACVITGFCDPHVTYIIPFSWVQDTDNIKKTEEASDGMYHILGEETYNRIADVVFELGGVDGTWNMISLNAVMHFWWAQARWGFEPVGVTEVDGRYRVEMIFRWMYRETAEFAEKEMDLDEGEDDLQELLARVQSWEGGEDEAGRPQGPVQSKGAGIGKFGMHHVDGPSIRSGRRIFILHDTRADAEKAMIVLKIQWACIRLMAISGAAELWKRDWDYEERCRRIRQQETEQHNEDMPRGRTRKRTGSWPEVAPEGPGSVSSTLSLPLRPLNPQPTPDPKRGYSQS
ncbi:hypothetical protein B0I35DRAFT_431865 [Stachybotrys elegans]|uniref:HNH nuclease domain-containing protein n=1 Tax=Stachybotrys elegans TaxID=80388 RepID=A0A8K0WQG3_9HYPO|nr:hypothetical protein B0I35DRAFT_431865 [Stachybotrys elegans]